MWSQEIATQHAEMSHLPARFARVPEILRGSRNDLLLLARDRAEADSVGVGNLIVRNLDASAERVAQFRMEWSGVEVLSLPDAVLSPAFPEFFPESRPVAHAHFTRVAARNPRIDRLLPIEKFTPDELFRRLAKSVIGQDEAMRAIAAIITGRVARRAPDDGRPIASILLPGPTGCGKTETGAALARALFGRPDARFIEIKLEQHRLNSHFLWGLEPGYKDVTDEMRRDGGGMITRPIIAQPGKLCLFLLDELEKGHEGVPDALFAAFDQGWARDSTSGHRVSFRDSIFIVTTNEADEAIRHMADSGANWEEVRKATPDLILSHGSHGWKPPFLARFDSVLPLSHPKPADILRIAGKLTRELLEKHHNFDSASPLFLEWAASTYQRTLGVRALKRTIEDRLDPQFGALPRDRGRLWLAVDGDGRLREAA
jgi:ATP-dependent Clp protease ATP-binding subunit ClpA